MDVTHAHVKLGEGGVRTTSSHLGPLAKKSHSASTKNRTRSASMAQLQTEGGVMFGEPTVIARAGAGGSVIGICAGPGPGSVTCTLQPHGVQIFDVASSTCTQSWALRGRRPALPAAVSSTTHPPQHHADSTPATPGG